MKTFPLLFAVLMILVVVVALVALRRRSAGRSSGPWPFYVKRPLSRPEQVLYHRLVKALPDHIVLAQVQVSRVLGVKKGVNFHEWNNRINRMSYDFVVCAKDSTVLAAIEVDDSTHEASARRAADAKKDKASSDAGLRVLRWHARQLPDEAAIALEFQSGEQAKAIVAAARASAQPSAQPPS